MSGEAAGQARTNGVGPAEQGANVTSPPSRFTAVNGRDSPASPGTMNGDQSPPEIARPANQRSPPNQSIEHGSARPGNREATQNMTNGDGMQRSLPGANHPQPPMLAHSILRRSPPQKRKRSPSAERRLSADPVSRDHGYRNSPLRDAQNTLVRFENGDRRRDSCSSSDGHKDPSADESRDYAVNGDPWYRNSAQPLRHSYDSRESSSVRGGHSDAELAEALRRESYPQADERGRRPDRRPDVDGARDQASSMVAEYGGRGDSIGPDYAPPRTRAEQLQADKRRKRIFSNRTKTGCLTCRRRKKKCDEGKPECNNCQRGGFVCEGYNNRVEWQKNSREKAPIPLQAKDGEPQGPTQYSRQTHEDSTQHRNSDASLIDHSLAGRRNSQNARNGADPNMRTIVLEDDGDRTLAPLSPRNRGQPGESVPKASWQHSGSRGYAADHLPKADFARVPPIHELSRAAEGDRPTPPSSHRSIMQSTHSPRTQQVQAQLALQHHNSVRSQPPPDTETDGRTEKEKMLAGALYMPTDAELKADRERCKGALWRFNNSMNPNLGISPEERDRLFRHVVQPQVKPGEGAMMGPSGRVGEDVIVEAPFNCDYGFNINIGAEVLIGTNCTIMDTCSVTIGARTVIGPNVNLLTATMPIDPRRRKGSQGPSLGRAIVIEEDCWIGAGVSILPGLKIGKSSTVGAGSVVTRDVPRFTVVAGNPARVHRGIYANDANM
ncbi:MAG: Maltose acetyltransferase [Caeruleum heppii]|nr:MAG: Maltose acetyltransferase [Caeruleum heppii]